jgi:hypothetical protein
LAFASDLTAYLLDDLVYRAGLPVMTCFDFEIGLTHPKPFHDYYRPDRHLHSVPASSTRWIEFTIFDGDFSPSVIPRESTRAALALHFQFGERKNGIREFQSQEPSELRPGVKEFRRVFAGLAVSGRTNTHTSFRDEWLIRV